MKLYHHPLSTTSRSVLFYAADHGIALDQQVVDLFAGEQLQPGYAALNPSQCVPVLQDGDFLLTESSAILKYLADRHGGLAYPAEPRERARTHERMDWLNTFFSREFCHGFVYPQLLPHHRRPTDELQAGTLARGRELSRRWLGVLDEHLIGPRHSFLGGNEPSLADYLGIAMATLGEAVHVDFAHWRNVSRWMAAMKARKGFAPSQSLFYERMVHPAAAARFEPL